MTLTVSQTDRRELRHEFERRYVSKAREAHFHSRSRAATAADVATSFQNVVGVGLSEKISNGKLTGDLAITVYVRRKVAASRLNRSRVPLKVSGFPTDVVAVGTPRALSSRMPVNDACLTDPEARQPRPFPAGVSVSGLTNGAGSIGYRVQRDGVDLPLILSNYHVLANLNDPDDQPPVFQPGAGDGTLDPEDMIGRYFVGVPLRFDGTANKMDAALAALKATYCAPRLCRFGKITTAADATGGDIVRIYGKQTRYAVGFVHNKLWEVWVKYGKRTARFIDQFIIERHPQSPSSVLAAHGDSGSIVVKEPATGCGLLFAASGKKFAYATPISVVFSRFKIAFV